MPRVSLPDGRSVDFPDGMSRQDMEAAMRQYLAETEGRGSALNRQAGFADNLIRSVARGATFDFADEIAAGIPAAAGAVRDWAAGSGPGFQSRYDAALSAERDRDKAFDQSNPVSSALGQVAGGMAVGAAVPMIRAFSGAGARAALGNTAVNAAAGGALSGFGAGEDGLANRLGSAAGSGILSGLAGPLLHSAVLAGGKLGRGIGNALGLNDAEARARRLLVRALERDKLDLDDLQARATIAQDPEILADIGGQNVLNLSRFIARIPSDASENAARVTANRRDARPDRIASAVDTALGGGAGSDVRDVVKSLSDQRKAAAAPLYAKAYEYEVKPSDVQGLREIIRDPISQQGISDTLATIHRQHNREGTSFVPRDYGAVMEGGKWKIDPAIIRGERMPTFRLLDAIKQSWDDVIDAARDPNTGAVNYTKHLIEVDKTRAKIRDHLADINPAYKEALIAWGGPSAAMDAVRRGEQAFRVNRDVVAAASGRVTDADRPFYEMGVGRAIADMTSDPARAGGAARRLTEDRAMGDRLASAIPDDMRRDYLIRALQREAKMAGVDRQVAPNAGSQTAVLGMIEDDASTFPIFGKALSWGRLGGPSGAAMGALNEVSHRAGGINTATASALSPYMFGSGPDAISRAIDAARRQRIEDQIKREIMNRLLTHGITGGAIGTSAAAN
jgi:hypothetical protein